MTIALASPVTGSAQNGFTSPSLTVVADSADTNAKRYAVSSVTGMPSVTVHTSDSPFTITFWRPAVIKLLEAAGLDGVIRRFPLNTYGITTRKGVTPAAGQVKQLYKIETRITCVSGSESYDAANVNAALSLHIGALSQQSAGLGDLVRTNIFG